MSDYGDEDFMMEDEEEDFDFEYEDDDDDQNNQEGEEDGSEVDLENRYYNAKGKKEDAPEEALAEFRGVVEKEKETEMGEWGFKALKQLTKLSYKLNKFKDTLEHYKELLTYVKSAVTRNYSEKSINNILDFVSSATDMIFLEEFYSITLSALEEAKNDRLWIKTNLKLAKLWLDRKEFTRLNRILRQLHASVEQEDGSGGSGLTKSSSAERLAASGGSSDVDQRKGTLLLEIYALEIQMYTEQKNHKKLKELYTQSLAVRSAIPHPRIMGVIRECGGKMHMTEKQWEKAQTDFYEAFKSYDEAGSPQRLTTLKYLVLVNMLMESTINPFDSQETKPYKNDPEIITMTNLVSAYQRKDIHEFEKLLSKNSHSIMSDAFIRDSISDLLRNIRTQVLVRMIAPYTRIEIQFLASSLNISVEEVEELLVTLVLDNKIQGKLDQVNGVVELLATTNDEKRYLALEKWADNVRGVYKTCLAKLVV